MKVTPDTQRAIRQMHAVIAAAGKACAGDDREAFATLVGSIGTFCAQRAGGVQMLGIAIETLQRAQAELETGAPMLDVPTGAPS